MRRKIAVAALGAAALGVAMTLAPSAALAASDKGSFSDVVLPDGQVGEIMTHVKDQKKASSAYCGYFADDFSASLGYYFAFTDSALSGDDVLAFCLEHFDDRWS